MTPTALAFAFTLMTVPPPADVRDVPPTQSNLRAAVSKALPVLWKGVDGHSAKKTCFTCHNHAVPLLAITTADRHGFPAEGVPLEVGSQAARAFQYSAHSGVSDMASSSTSGPTPSTRHRAPVRFSRRFTRCLIVPSTSPLPID